jgi:hypothetical protein
VLDQSCRSTGSQELLQRKPLTLLRDVVYTSNGLRNTNRVINCEGHETQNGTLNSLLKLEEMPPASE